MSRARVNTTFGRQEIPTHQEPPPFPPSDPGDAEYPEGNSEVVSKGPCPKCPTERGNVTFADGHAHCFACGHWTPGDPASGASAQAGGRLDGDVHPQPRQGAGPVDDALLDPKDASDPWRHLEKRRLTSATLKRYGYFQTGFKGQVVHVAPYYDQEGQMVAQKLRFPDKSFTTKSMGSLLRGGPTVGSCRLFGHQVFGDKYDKRVVITEGEIDAMSVAQATDFKFPALSITTGSSGAAKSLKANWLWLNRFQEIILWFDDDEPGRKAAEECATLFAVGKVKIAKMAGCKDASDVLQRNTPGDIELAIFMATLWRPPGIVNAADRSDDVCAPKEDDATNWSYQWPWAPLTDYFGPIRPGQVVYHVAGTGIGKTSAIAEIEMWLCGQGAKIAHLGFEDTRRDVKLRLMSILSDQRLDIEQLDDAEMRRLHELVFGGRSIELFDPETAEWSFDAVMGYIRYCAKALDCRVIFVDPLTFIAGLMRDGDQQRALEGAATELALIAKELGVHIQVAHHLTEPRGDGPKLTEGGQTSLNQVRGSGGIANFAVIVIGHERNQQAPGQLALLTQLRSLKNRPRSRTGPMMVLEYSLATGRLKPSDKSFPGDGKRHRTPSFSDASSPSNNNNNTDY